MEEGGYSYILSSRTNKVLYIGVTNDLVRRLIEHRTNDSPKSFVTRYNVYKLVYYQFHEGIVEAINHEKVLKKWRREWKDRLILLHNPNWVDLTTMLLEEEDISAEELFEDFPEMKIE